MGAVKGDRRVTDGKTRECIGWFGYETCCTDGEPWMCDGGSWHRDRTDGHGFRSKEMLLDYTRSSYRRLRLVCVWTIVKEVSNAPVPVVG